jgi:DNA-directed RNA polymerase specialized sigma24 family protein
MTTNMNEEQIVQRVLQGEPEAFQGIVEHYQGPVLRLLRHLIGHEQASEDIAQDVFMTVYMKLKTICIGRWEPGRVSAPLSIRRQSGNECP